VFFAPPEVHQSILDVCKKSPFQHVDSSDVVLWLLEQSCRGNEQLQSLYIAQGLEFCRRTNAALEYPHFLSKKKHRSALLGVIESPERLTLEELYGVRAEKHRSASEHITHSGLRDIVKELATQRQITDHHHSSLSHSAMEEVEQEREVEFQVEEIREVQRPERHQALQFPGRHPGISHFVETGFLGGAEGYELAFSALSRTYLAKKYNLRHRGSQLLVSTEFMRTIVLRPGRPDDDFLVSSTLSH
jgi:hypothetical protein